ncbi:MAG TPA: YfiR family protein, partial [Burkholderiaceae bacterium]|nr:YfiR family protein [Burkholderiaceae bacterium]
LLAAAVAWVSPSHAQTDELNAERQVKAAFLYKFAGYVDWPPGALGAPDAPFAIGVLGAEPLAVELTQVVNGRKVQERPITVRRLKGGEALSDVAILFVGKTETARLKSLMSAQPPRPILVVTESEGALAQGGMINFLVVDRRVRFEISLDSAEKSGLRLSSRLLAVAQKVQTGSP